MRKILALVLAVCMAAVLLAGTERAVKAEDAAGKETWTFIDQADNEVTVEIPVERMVVLQHHSIDILCQLGAEEQIVGKIVFCIWPFSRFGKIQ